ncbi:hypothetical protein [Chromobacterium amazonense]|uniref:hypothetical protein n=1 Tax=Chromobacterium amazonense TaxID=1382803 RepID=UPI003F796ABF
MDGVFRVEASKQRQNDNKEAMLNGTVDFTGWSNRDMASMIKHIIKTELQLPEAGALAKDYNESDPCAMYREMLDNLSGPAKCCGEYLMKTLALAYQQTLENKSNGKEQKEFNSISVLKSVVLHKDDVSHYPSLGSNEERAYINKYEGIRKAILGNWPTTLQGSGGYFRPPVPERMIARLSTAAEINEMYDRM